MKRRLKTLINRHGKALFSVFFAAQLLVVSWHLHQIIQERPELWMRALLLGALVEGFAGIILWRLFLSRGERALVQLFSGFIWIQGLYFVAKGHTEGDLSIALWGAALFIGGFGVIALDIFWPRRS